MNSGKYQLKSFLTDHNLDQIVIPEIQRDYVWREVNVIKLLESIKLNADRQKSISQTISDEQLNQLPPEAREILIRGLEDKKQFCNVGFIYAYFDPELAGRFILIDGQQRMTTLFLLLLSKCVQEGREDYFRRSYFQDGNLKFDYKVREEAHEFLYNFVNHILDGNTLSEVDDQHWFFNEYETDSTIGSLLRNYRIILDFIANNKISLEYIEDYIEFWYFDTNKSKQGEELYIYMNSRGVAVSANESIKANLLKGLSEKEKHEWGIKWEKWQDLFWKNRGQNLNADKGFEEFLKWIKIIEYIKHDSGKETQQAQINKLRDTRENKRITEEYFTLSGIENYFSSLNTILKFKNEINFELRWIAGQTEGIDYIRLMPMLMYALKYSECSLSDIKRFSRFFYNITKFDTLSKNPYVAAISVVNLTHHFLNANHSDATDLIRFSSNKSFENILTQEEIIKLTLYAKRPDDRTNIERAFWEAEDHKYCNGKIAFLLDYLEPQATLNNIESFSYSEFKETFTNFKILFNQPDDIVRRTLLTKGDYSTYDGRTSTLNGDRYSFIIEDWRWRQQFPNKNKVPFFKDLIQDYGLRKKKNPALSREQILNQIIAEFLIKYSGFDWRYYAISKPEVLAYCRQKFICFTENVVYLLQDKNAGMYNYEKLEKHLGYE